MHLGHYYLGKYVSVWGFTSAGCRMCTDTHLLLPSPLPRKFLKVKFLQSVQSKKKLMQNKFTIVEMLERDKHVMLLS